jgi:LmbE family N-acetylglucosaminyl deacetylase
MRQVALSFLAHPDDAEILCGGTLIRLADAGWEIHIATATAGDCGTMIENPWDISSIRTKEAQKAAGLIGATYHCLGEPDGMVVYDKPTIRKTLDLFRRIAPSLVLTHAPKDYMIDHEQVSLLGRGASFVYGAPNISAFPRHAQSAVPHLYYCDPVELVDPLGHEVQPTVRINISAQMDRKAQMLACHASQRDWLKAHHGMDEYIDAMKRISAQRGSEMGAQYAEGFIQHQGHAYPHNDLLAELFGDREDKKTNTK